MGRGPVILGARGLTNRLGSRFGANTKVVCGVIGPKSTPYDYLLVNSIFYKVVSL